MTSSLARPVRVLISYAHDDEKHRQKVRDFWSLLRGNGIDARLDLPAADRPQDWPVWMLREIREADYILVVGSPMYKQRAEGHIPPGSGRGVGWESRLLRQEVYDDPGTALLKILPVVLPGCSLHDLPGWLSPMSGTYYEVTAYTVEGAERLLRYLTGQRKIAVPELGPVPVMPAEGPGTIEHSPASRQSAAVGAQQLISEFGERYGEALRGEFVRQVANVVSDTRNPFSSSSTARSSAIPARSRASTTQTCKRR